MVALRPVACAAMTAEKRFVTSSPLCLITPKLSFNASRVVRGEVKSANALGSTGCCGFATPTITSEVTSAEDMLPTNVCLGLLLFQHFSNFPDGCRHLLVLKIGDLDEFVVIEHHHQR